ncbi:MAG: hypothetical protein WCI04_05095 [archaeon]
MTGIGICVMCQKSNGTVCGHCYGIALEHERNKARKEGAKQELERLLKDVRDIITYSNGTFYKIEIEKLIEDYLKELEK